MRISEAIVALELLRTEHGDVELYVEENDGYSTRSAKLKGFDIRLQKIWPKHPTPARHYLTMRGKY